MRKFLSLFLLLLLLLGCNAEIETDPVIVKQKLGDGPFGTYMEMPISEFTRLIEIDRNFYKTLTVPRNSAAIDFYEVYFDDVGLCMIQAIGNDIQTDPAGDEVKFQFGRFSEALVKKYGEFKTFNDQDNSEEGKSKPVSWMSRVLEGDQVYEKYWQASEDNPLSANIDSISLWVKALREDVAYVIVRYEFENYTKCQEMDKAVELDDL